MTGSGVSWKLRGQRSLFGLVVLLVASSFDEFGVEAHGFISKPEGKYKDAGKKTFYNAIMTAKDLGGEWEKAGNWKMDATEAAKLFAKVAGMTGTKTTKELVDKKVPDCANSDISGAPQDVSQLKTMVWENTEPSGKKYGFVDSHAGPCEVWIDDKMIVHDDNCVGKFKGAPAEIPVDYSGCKGKCQLTFYWIALHESDWQLYKQCVPIQNGAGGGGGGGGGPTAGVTGPNPAPATPGKKKNCKRRLRDDWE